MKRLKIGFIGAGTTGTALAVRLKEKGYPIVAIASRTQASAKRLAERLGDDSLANVSLQGVADQAELIFITTSDDAIGLVAKAINWQPGQYVVHCSGADSLDILAPVVKAGAQAGSFHPLQTFAEVNYAIANLPGSTFALEADEPLLSILKELALALDGRWIELKPGDKAIYHTAAVLACNYLVTLVKLATDLWQSFGVMPSQSTQALLPLLRGTINNLANVGLPDCLTGPIARGDLGTIKRHLEVLEAKAPQMLSTYQELGQQTIPIALAKGKIDAEKAEELRKLFSEIGGAL
jgi:predicted short-subunit dehydrogenase-like oxidoreductase (DUF2520 family)